MCDQISPGDARTLGKDSLAAASARTTAQQGPGTVLYGSHSEPGRNSSLIMMLGIKRRVEPPSAAAAKDYYSKRLMMTPLHKEHVVPMAFFDEAIGDSKNFLKENKVGKPFGLHNEAYLRKCYKELNEEIQKELAAWIEPQVANGVLRPRLVEIRGSSGIGKSVFLAYLIAVYMQQGEMANFAIFHSNKAGKSVPDLDDVLCSLYIDGEKVMDKQRYGLDETRLKLDSHVVKLDALFMDGCSMSFSLEQFYGIVFVAASPSVYTKNLRDALAFYRTLCMPTWSRKESMELGNMLGIEEDRVNDNYDHMNGIVRYMFEEGMAKMKVDDSVKVVSPKSLCAMAATQRTDKETERVMVHALVRWEPPKNADQSFKYDGDISFDLVSRYAEAMVAQKLYKENLTELKETTAKLRSLPGAEGYAGALFEAYAVRRFLGGGTFLLEGLQGQASKSITIPKLGDAVVLQCNALSADTVPYGEILQQATDGAWRPRMVWPTTNNFPTFDFYYFHTDGTLYPLQVTIADEKHPLKNGGAYQTVKYMEGISTTQTPYHAVFVVPEARLNKLKKQPFEGNVLKGKKIIVKEEDASNTMETYFQQWLIEI